VSLVELRGTRFLVAPRGRTQWVRNAEAAGEVVLKRGSSRQRFRLRAVPGGDKPPVLRAYLDRFRPVVQRFFPVPAGSPPQAFAPIVERYPVFEFGAAQRHGGPPMKLSVDSLTSLSLSKRDAGNFNLVSRSAVDRLHRAFAVGAG